MRKRRWGLERAIRDDLSTNIELDPREEALLAAAARQADDIAALEAGIERCGHVPLVWRRAPFGA